MNLRRFAVICHDIVMSALAWELAWLARFNFRIPEPEYVQANLQTLPFVILIQAVYSWHFELYRGVWRFASLPDLANIVKYAFVGVLTITLLLFVAFRLEDVPRSVLVFYPFVLIFLVSGPRLLYRLWKDRLLFIKGVKGRNKVLVIGAGRGGESLVRDMLTGNDCYPVGYLDDNNLLAHTRIQGVPILGKVKDLVSVVAQYDVDVVIIAIPSATSAQMQHIVGHCEQGGKPFRTLPRIEDIINGSPKLHELREVYIDDLLGRDKVRLDWTLIGEGITDKTVMVTGGGGSIGSELCQQIARLNPDRLIVVELNEYNLYRIDMELRKHHPSLKLEVALCDVRDRVGMQRLIGAHSPQIIFHAAAYKHVPILENEIRQAVQNNILGTKVVAELACNHGCEKFVLISTDKAVNPSSVMGATKRAAEILCEMMDKHGDTRFITVRFGNVLDSAGSVVPLFREQIRSGGPVTVTHPDVRRYFMTIPEACQLILQAGAMGEGGEIYVLDMGKPVRIAYLAEQLIRLSGHVPSKEIKIEYTGLRPGEKLNEELFHPYEDLSRTGHDKIMLARHQEGIYANISNIIPELRIACEQNDEERIKVALGRLLGHLQDHPLLGRELHEIPESAIVELKLIGN